MHNLHLGANLHPRVYFGHVNGATPTFERVQINLHPGAKQQLEKNHTNEKKITDMLSISLTITINETCTTCNDP